MRLPDPVRATETTVLLMACLLAAGALTGCVAVGYSSGGGWFIWPSGGVLLLLLILFLIFRRR